MNAMPDDLKPQEPDLEGLRELLARADEVVMTAPVFGGVPDEIKRAFDALWNARWPLLSRLQAAEAERDDVHEQWVKELARFEDASARAEAAEALAAERGELLREARAALEPFAEVGKALVGHSVEYTVGIPRDLRGGVPMVSAGDFRRARTVHATIRETGK